jgi:hypothetical protein
MIHFEGTRPLRLESSNYNDLLIPKNNHMDIVLHNEEGKLLEDEFAFFSKILEELIDSVSETDEEMVKRCHKHYLGRRETMCVQMRKQDPLSVTKSIWSLGEDFHENTKSNQVRHVKVLQQNSSKLCGFHMYFNAQQMVKSLLADNMYDRYAELLSLQSSPKLQREYFRMMKLLMQCKSSFLVPEKEKDDLERGYPLERTHLEYLVNTDPALKALTSPDYLIQFGTIEHTFGLFKQTPEQIIDLHEKFTNF